MEAIETIETDLGTLNIYHDEFVESPFDMYDNLGTIYHWHRRYNLGTEVRDEEEIPKGIRLPVYLYDHSGITLNTSGFSCGWDSGQVGWIVAEFDKVREQYNCKGINPATRKKVLKVLKVIKDLLGRQGRKDQRVTRDNLETRGQKDHKDLRVLKVTKAR